MPISRRHRPKVFGDGPRVPLDGNAKVRIEHAARVYNARHKQPNQHIGPLTRAFLRVLHVLLRTFHNGKTGACFPSYEAIAAAANCARSVVADAIEALEFAHIITWAHRIVSVRVRCLDLFGRPTTRWKVLRRSNAYTLIDPHPNVVLGGSGRVFGGSENRTGTQEVSKKEEERGSHTRAQDPNSPLERALARLGAAINEASGLGKGCGVGGVSAPS